MQKKETWKRGENTKTEIKAGNQLKSPESLINVKEKWVEILQMLKVKLFKTRTRESEYVTIKCLKKTKVAFLEIQPIRKSRKQRFQALIDS